MKIFEIKNRWSGKPIHSIEAESLSDAVARLVANRAVLRSADLSGADLSGADLRSAVLTPIRDDLWAVLSAAPREVAGLRLALIEGRVDGSAYEGECACLLGTIANIRHVDYRELGLVQPNASRPAERFFMSISQGDTPEKNQFSKLALEWVDMWLDSVRDAFGNAA